MVLRILPHSSSCHTPLMGRKKEKSKVKHILLVDNIFISCINSSKKIKIYHICTYPCLTARTFEYTMILLDSTCVEGLAVTHVDITVIKDSFINIKIEFDISSV